MHFIGRNGPTEDYRDPIPATASEVKLQPAVINNDKSAADESLIVLPTTTVCKSDDESVAVKALIGLSNSAVPSNSAGFDGDLCKDLNSQITEKPLLVTITTGTTQVINVILH